MKKIISFLCLAFLPLTFISCQKRLGNADKYVNLRGYVFDDSYRAHYSTLRSNIPLYFFNENKNIPYMSITDLIDKFGDIYLSGIDSVQNKLRVNQQDAIYTITNPISNQTLKLDMETGQYIYSLKDEFLVTDSYLVNDPFNVIPDDPSITSMFKINNHQYNKGASDVMGNLNDYNIAPIYQKGVGYLPLKIGLDLIRSSLDNNVIYNGTDLFQLSPALLSLTDITTLVNEMLRTWNVDTNNTDFLRFALNEMCFLLNQEHGMKDKFNITNYRQFINEIGLENEFLNSPYSFNIALCKLFGDNLADGGHTAVIDMYKDAKNIHPEDYYMGRNIKSIFEFMTSRSRCGIHIPYDPSSDYGDMIQIKTKRRTNDKTLFLTFDSFDYFALDLLKEALRRIKNDSNIKNVVLDLSCNQGGLGFLVPVFESFLVGSSTMTMKNPSTGALSTTTYQCDINGDGKFNDDDNVKKLNRYIITSNNSFSCGNMLPCLAKMHDSNIKIIGEDTGGGACAVGYGVNALGTIYTYSLNFVSCTYQDEQALDTDAGVKADIPLNRYDDFYLRQNIVDTILS